MQNSGCITAQVKDMKLMTAAAPGNPITPVTYTGFQFVPKQDYFQSFQGGVLAKLAVWTPWQSLLRSRLQAGSCCVF